MGSISLPKHIAIIMDGNGRWAQRRGLPRLAGHLEGMHRVTDIVRHASHSGIRFLTLYAFSTENWKRPLEEREGLMRLLRQFIRTKLDELVEENVRIHVLGDIRRFSKSVQDALQHALDTSAHCDGMQLNLALNYGARDEIVRAFKTLKERGMEDISEDDIADALYTGGQPDPDLIIRTGGDVRLSNFLLYQAAYSELLFVDSLWPDFHEKDFDEAMQNYQIRQRRYGAIP